MNYDQCNPLPLNTIVDGIEKAVIICNDYKEKGKIRQTNSHHAFNLRCLDKVSVMIEKSYIVNKTQVTNTKRPKKNAYYDGMDIVRVSCREYFPYRKNRFVRLTCNTNVIIVNEKSYVNVKS